MTNEALQKFRRERLAALLVHPEFGDNKAALGRALGYSSGAYVRQMIEGERPITEKKVELLHSFKGGKFKGWFNPPVGDAAPADAASLKRMMAQHLSHDVTTMDPITMEWESVLSQPLPEVFRLVLRDDAMAPRFGKGTVVIFSTASKPPKAGDLVLVRDRDDGLHFREYEAGRGAAWRAVASASGYKALESDEDGLQVLAKARGTWWPED